MLTEGLFFTMFPCLFYRKLQVPRRASSLNSGDMFVLETPYVAYLWRGKVITPFSSSLTFCLNFSYYLIKVTSLKNFSCNVMIGLPSDKYLVFLCDDCAIITPCVSSSTYVILFILFFNRAHAQLKGGMPDS